MVEGLITTAQRSVSAGKVCVTTSCPNVCVHCFSRIFQTQVADELRQRVVLATLRESCADTLLGEMELVHNHLTVECRVEEQHATADLVLDIMEEFFR